jgi:uncharacterized protein (TIGR03546 family)
MIVFKIIRKIGKILRGGAGRKEILLGTLCGVLIGFNPGISFTLVAAILITLLLNANISFTLLGAALGKVLSLILAPISFHTGYFIIHKIGLEGAFQSLCNKPVTALMDLNVYALVGSLPYALATGLVIGIVLGSAITRIRKKMLEADQHEIIGKTVKNKISRFLLWLAFGKSKLSFEDEIPKKAPIFRKSGLMVIGIVVVIGLAMEFLLLNMIVKHGLQSSISAVTGAEVNISTAHLSMAKGELKLNDLQVTDPDRPTHNLMQLDTLAVDISISDLLRNSYVIDLVEGSTLKRNVPRNSPGAVYEKTKKEKNAPQEDLPGKSLEDYFAKARDWEAYGEKAYTYLKDRKTKSESVAKGQRPEASKEVALANADRLGYLRAAADLVSDRPAWLVRELKIDNVLLGEGHPPQVLHATELCSHPELNGKPTMVEMTPAGMTNPSAKLFLRFDNPDAQHAITFNLADIALGENIETSSSFPVDISGGQADIKADGLFSSDALGIPFSIVVHNLKANVEEGQSIMGMDSATATEVLSSMELLEIDGSLEGSLLAPRVRIDYDKLTANIKSALMASGKKALANRADAEMDKAKEELKGQAGEEINKLLGGKEGESTEDKAKSALKKLF